MVHCVRRQLVIHRASSHTLKGNREHGAGLERVFKTDDMTLFISDVFNEILPVEISVKQNLADILVQLRRTAERRKDLVGNVGLRVAFVNGNVKREVRAGVHGEHVVGQRFNHSHNKVVSLQRLILVNVLTIACELLVELGKQTILNRGVGRDFLEYLLVVLVGRNQFFHGRNAVPDVPEHRVVRKGVQETLCKLIKDIHTLNTPLYQHVAIKQVILLSSEPVDYP